MSTVREAVSQLGWPVDAPYDIPIARIAGGKILHSTVKESGERDVSELGDAYVTAALYKPGSISVKGGRSKENVERVLEIPFDCDLKDYLGIPASQLHETPHEDLDGYITALTTDAQEVFRLAGIPIHRIVCTGYGIALYVRLHDDDQRRVAEVGHVHKRLVERVNGLFGGSLVDPSVSDAATRLTRLIGSLNHKGTTPRTVYTIAEYPGEARLDDFGVEPAPPPARITPIAEKALDDDTLASLILALSSEYAEGNRNAIAHGVSGLLAKSGVPLEQALDIMSEVARDDEEVSNRLDAVRRTYKRWEQGSNVAGYQFLSSLSMSPASLDYISGKLDRYSQATVIINPTAEEETPNERWELFDLPPEEAFYGPAGEYRDLMAPTTEASDAFHLASWLTYSGICIGRKAFTRNARDLYPTLYTVLVGDTGGSRKDTAAILARQHFAKQASLMGLELTPLPYTTLSNLSTAEGLLQHMQQYGNTVMVHTSEYDILLGRGRREVSVGLIGQLTDIWDCPPAADIPTRKDPIRVENPTLSLLATVTPQILAEEMTGRDIRSGFANRQLFVFGHGKGMIADPPPPDEREAKRQIAQLQIALRSLGPGREFHKTPAAKRVWADWYAEFWHRDYLNEDEAHLSRRMGANIHRIALIFAVVEGVTAISEAHLRAAIAWVEWCFEQTRKASRMWGANAEAQLADRIRQALRRRPLTRQEVVTAVGIKWGLTTIERTLEAMRKMEQIAYAQDGRMTWLPIA